MDIEGFSFLIPFDERVVSEALSQHIQADGYGERFLEKILDYHVYLTPASERQITTFFHSELKQHCPFIRTDMLDGLDKYLPSSPRKLKALTRSLKLYRSEGERHRPEEIDWKSVIFAQMIKMESEPFFQIFKEDTFGKKKNIDVDNMSDCNPWMSAIMGKDKNKAEAIETERLNRLLVKAGIEVPEIKERLIKICEGWHACQGYWHLQKIFYALRLLDTPEVLTLAEFEDFWITWSQNKVLSDLTPWIFDHAKKMDKSEAEIAHELIKTLIQQYNLHLEKAATVSLLSDLKTCINDANKVLELLDLLVSEGFSTISPEELLTVDAFEKIYGLCFKWAHFTGNAADKDLRTKESTFLQKWVQKVNEIGNSADYAIFIKSGRQSSFDNKEALKLRDDVFAIFDLDADDRALDVLQAEGGVAGLFPYEAGAGIKDKLLNVKSGLWNQKEESPAFKILEAANKKPAIQLNARELLGLLQHVMKEGTWGLERADIEEFYKHSDFDRKNMGCRHSYASSVQDAFSHAGYLGISNC